MTTVAVVGASGRLGSLVCEVIESMPGFVLAAKLTSTSRPEDADAAQIVFDVSHPHSSELIVKRALGNGQRVIVGTSGWSASKLDALRPIAQQSGETAVLIVPNFSLGAVIESRLAAIAAPYFDSIEIVESHHENKVDSPSGTAVRTAEIIAEARAGLEISSPFSEQPARGELIAGVAVHSLRMRGVVAKQEIRFGGQGEVLTITHDTHSRDAYRAGIRASLEKVSELQGLVVGLEHVLGL